MPISPISNYVVFDLEATDTDPTAAEIVQIAALHPGKTPFMSFVETSQTLLEDAKVWGITKIDFVTYQENKKPLKAVLNEFLDYIGTSPLAGHNIHRYDLPLLTRALNGVGLTLPTLSEPSIDTQRWAQLRYPTPPATLKGYSLGHLYQFFTGHNFEGAHQADKDCEANREVLHHLYLDPPPQQTLMLWTYLGLSEASWYDSDPSDIVLEALLKVPAKVAWLNQPGKPFSGVEQLVPAWLEQLDPPEVNVVAEGTHALNARFPEAKEQARRFLDILGGYRPSQVTMMREP